MKRRTLFACLGLILFLGCAMLSQATEPAPVRMAGAPQTSHAVFSDTTEDYPTIKISEDTITITHRESGSGKVQGTSLRGQETYTFHADGTYKVKPGTYKHIVFGHVPSKGKIESVVRYR